MNKNEQKKENFALLAKVFSFFALEIIALLAFGLGNNFIFFAIISIVSSILLVGVSAFELKKYGLSKMLCICLIPLVIVFILCLLSNFNRDLAYPYQNQQWVYILLLFSLVGMLLAGYSFKLHNVFSLRTVMIVIYGAISLYVLINLIVTMIQFCPFYAYIYYGKVFYYEGKPSPVSVDQMAFALMNFSVEEVSIQYYSLFPSLLLTSVIFLFFNKYKDNKTMYLTFLGFFVLGTLTIVLSTNILVFIADVIIVASIALIIFYSKKKHSKTPLKVVLISLLVLASIGFILFFLNSQSKLGTNLQITGLQQFISNNQFLNFVFNRNYYARQFKPVLDGLVSEIQVPGEGPIFYKFLGFPTGSINGLDTPAYETDCFLFNSFITSGILGFANLIFLLSIIFITLVKFFKFGKVNQEYKGMIFAFVLAFFIYNLFNADMSPCIFNRSVSPLLMSSLALVVTFLIGIAAAESRKGKTDEKAI